jgi:hypothetical protein
MCSLNLVAITVYKNADIENVSRIFACGIAYQLSNNSATI